METLYDNGIHEVLIVRNVLSQTLFRNEDIQRSFMRLIADHIDILKCEYNSEQLTYTIKVKKTSVKRLPNFRAEACFYYNIIGAIMQDLLTLYEDRVISIFETHPAIIRIFNTNNFRLESYNLYNRLLSNNVQLCNLANIQCISDNIIQIIM